MPAESLIVAPMGASSMARCRGFAMSHREPNSSKKQYRIDFMMSKVYTFFAHIYLIQAYLNCSIILYPTRV